MQKQTATATSTNRIIPVRIVHKRLGKKRRIILTVLLVVLVVSGAAWCMYRRTDSTMAKIETDKYQVVFAGNNQAWFGKLHLLSDGSYQLTNVFYYSGQNSTSSAQSPNANTETPQLIKMGSELHGPTDEIVFPKGQVVFWENLRPDSKVTQAINSYVKK